MATAKKKAAEANVAPAKLQKATTVPKAEMAKLKLDDLWVLRASDARVRARFCGCRTICIV
jgi:hypothetical protein